MDRLVVFVFVSFFMHITKHSFHLMTIHEPFTNNLHYVSSFIFVCSLLIALFTNYILPNHSDRKSVV